MIDGVGGAFIFSNAPQRLADWYSEHLGVEFDRAADGSAFYTMYWALDPEDTTRKLDTTFSIMQASVPLPVRDSAEPEPGSMYGDQAFMVNLRVRDMDATLSALASKGVNAIKRDDFEYGRFAWVRDADGNRVELYQPLATA